MPALFLPHRISGNHCGSRGKIPPATLRAGPGPQLRPKKKNIWEAKARRHGILFRTASALIHQAKNSLALWTGLDIDTDVFHKALEDLEDGEGEG
ncbi:MAG: hypothetical protein R2861_10785 [Desulfobacterales bacterium]